MQRDLAVYIIDDDDEVCRSLLQLLRTMNGVTPQAWSSADAFLVDLDLLERGIVITDVCMPGSDGLMLIAAMRARARHDPIIVITGHADVPLAVTALKAGAVDFIEKPFESEAFLAAVEQARNGSVAPDVHMTLARIETLSKREYEVFEHLIEGATNKHIAYELAISPRTVEIYRANLMTKMQATSLSHLVRMGVEAGITRRATVQ